MRNLFKILNNLIIILFMKHYKFVSFDGASTSKKASDVSNYKNYRNLNKIIIIFK